MYNFAGFRHGNLPVFFSMMITEAGIVLILFSNFEQTVHIIQFF